jgi:PhzF family phenazine biosynthesis protein
MGVRIYHVDAFTDQVFKGNPAGVCILETAANEQWMRDVAMEMNLSETAFLNPQDGGFNLRWFTPETEVDLCGHATLASAHTLWETGVLPIEREAIFFTKSGRLSAKRDGEYIVLNFPLEEDNPVETPEALQKSLGVPFIYTGRNRMDYIVEVGDEETVRKLEPDFEIMKEIDARGVIVTSPSANPEYDFVSRFFAPGLGVPEDPVTGSAHCCLGPYWQRRLGKEEMAAHQVSKRGGALKVTLKGDRVYIGGKAVTVFCAEFGGQG